MTKSLIFSVKESQMIEIKMSGMCKGCSLSELYLDTTHVYGFYGYENIYSIHCRHEKVCAKYTSEKGNDGKKGNKKCLTR